MPNFTPGPWAYTLDGFVADKTLQLICQTWNKNEDDFDNFKNNGHLLAAAPDLYAALKAVEFVGMGGYTACPACMGDGYHGENCQLALALKKAEGKK